MHQDIGSTFCLRYLAGDFKTQLTSALSTLRDNLVSEKTALRAALEAEKQREIESHVAAARSEYEAVMNRYEQSTETWRRDTVAACERSLDAARLQVRSAPAERNAIGPSYLAWILPAGQRRPGAFSSAGSRDYALEART
jgi:hypothetical protein